MTTKVRIAIGCILSVLLLTITLTVLSAANFDGSTPPCPAYTLADEKEKNFPV
jgi:hypothetical protein